MPAIEPTRKSIMDTVLNKTFIKVTKREPDGRLHLCGSRVQVDAQGREFFLVPAHQADYIRDTNPQYIVSDEVYNGATTASGPAQVSPPPPMAETYVEPRKPMGPPKGEFPCDVCGKVLNTKVGLIGHKRSHAKG